LSIDPEVLGTLIEESEDLHTDAMRTTRAGLSDMVEYGQDVRARGGVDPDETRQHSLDRKKALTAAGVLAGVGTGAALMGALGASAAFADAPADIAAAQTAASLENLAVAVYTKAAGLPFMGNIPAPAGPTVVAFVKMTIAQHTDHANAFNAAASTLGGKKQTGPDMVVYNAVVTPALPTLMAPLDVVKFASQLELVAAETYTVATASVSDKMLRSTFASIAGVENQHAAVLYAVAALLEANMPQLIKLDGVNAMLPAAAGSVGFPDTFVKTDMARPLTEGAVK